VDAAHWFSGAPHFLSLPWRSDKLCGARKGARMSAKKNPIRPFRASKSIPARYQYPNLKSPFLCRPLIGHNFYPPEEQRWWDQEEQLAQQNTEAVPQ
jgi:hypothetical protein